MSSPGLSLSPTPELPEAEHNDATTHPLEGLEDGDGAIARPFDSNTGNGIEDDSDADSILSEIDEAQFDDFDPNQITVDERPAIAIDEDNVKLLGRHKRKPQKDGDYVDGQDEQKRKKREGKREKKTKRPRKKKAVTSDDDLSGGEVSGKRVRKPKAVTEGPDSVDGQPRARSPEDESQLTPEERK